MPTRIQAISAKLSEIDQRLCEVGLSNAITERYFADYESLLSSLVDERAVDISDVQFKLISLSNLVFPDGLDADDGIERLLMRSVLDDVKSLSAS